MRPDELLAGLREARLLAIIRGSDAEASIRTALALLEEGFRYLEVSLNTVSALTVIETVRTQAPAGTFVGAGTVLTADDVRRVREAGGQFMVTPAVTEAVAESARVEIPVIAGALTPTEARTAMVAGATAIKLFPASLGGPAYLSALLDPFPDMPLVAVGGVDVEAAQEYLRRGAAAVGLGSPLIKDAAGGGDLNELRGRARRFLDVAAAAGSSADTSPGAGANQ